MSTTRKDPFDVLREKGLFIPVIVAVFALIGGMFLGLGMAEVDSQFTAAEPRVIERVVTKEVEVAIEVPVVTAADSCVDALDNADEGFAQAGRAISYMQDAANAVAEQDADALRTATNKFQKVNEKLDTTSRLYMTNKTECKYLNENGENNVESISR